MKTCGCIRCKEREQAQEMEGIKALNAAFMDLMVASFGVDEEINCEMRAERDGLYQTTIRDICDWYSVKWDRYPSDPGREDRPFWDTSPEWEDGPPEGWDSA
jgi:hypothetical protein